MYTYQSAAVCSAGQMGGCDGGGVVALKGQFLDPAIMVEGMFWIFARYSLAGREEGFIGSCPF